MAEKQAEQTAEQKTEQAATSAEPTAEKEQTVLGAATKAPAQPLPHAWMSGLTTEQKADAELVKLLSRYERGIPDLSKAVAELEKKASRPAVPDEKASAEEWAAYRKAIGVPEKPTEYKLEKGPAPKGMEIPDGAEKALRETAHKLGLTQDQASALFKWYQIQRLQEFRDAVVEAKTTREKTEAELKAELKGNYNQEIAYMQRAVERYFKDPRTKADLGLADLFSQSGLGNDKRVIRMFARIGRDMAEHGFVEGSAPAERGSTFGHRPDAEIAELVYGRQSQ